MPWTSAFFTSSPARTAASARMSDALRTPCPPRPAKTTFTTLPGLISVHPERRAAKRPGVEGPCSFLRARRAGELGATLGARLLPLPDVRRGEDARAARDDDR